MWEEYHNHSTHNYSNEYSLGFANGQPFLYIEGTNKQRNNMKKYYFSILIQDSDTISEIDTLRKKFAENDDFNICAYVCDMFCGIGFEDDKDNFTDYKPYICKGSDFIVRTYREYTLVRNLAVCGNYMLYREATAEEVEWLEENK